METDTANFRPPYMSFQTFWSFIEELSAKPLPPRVDRSLMSTKSGTDQNNLIMALTSFGFTDDEGRVRSPLAELVGAPSDERLATFAASVRRYYAAPLAVSDENGTTGDLNSVFTETWPSIASADTRRKSVTFFLHASRAAGIELSPHFPAGRPGSGGPGSAKKRTTGRRRQSGAAADEGNGSGTTTTRAPVSTGGYTKTVNLRSGGIVTLSWDVNLAESDDLDETFVLELVRQLRRYQSGAVDSGDPKEAAS